MHVGGKAFTFETLELLDYCEWSRVAWCVVSDKNSARDPSESIRAPTVQFRAATRLFSETFPDALKHVI